MRHQNDVKALCNEYGLEYLGYYRHINKHGFDTGKLCARFAKDDKIIWRVIYKSQTGEFVRFAGRVFYFD